MRQFAFVALTMGVLPLTLPATAHAAGTGSSAPQTTTRSIPSSVGLDSEEWAFLPLINEYRAKYGVSPLQMSNTLAQASEWMSQDMAQKNYFSHTDSLGRGLKDRLASFGYGGAMAENIAAGQKTAEEVFKAWESSPGHRENMLNPTYAVIGVGRIVADGSQYGIYWTTDFGSTVDTVVEQDAAHSVSMTPVPAPAHGEKGSREYLKEWWIKRKLIRQNWREMLRLDR